MKNRKKALERDGNKCVMCGTKRRIHVHHLDKNRKNNSIDNLITLCLSHHLRIHLRTPVFPHKRKIISMRRKGASLQDIARWLNLGTKTAAYYVLEKETKKDPTIEIDHMNHIHEDKYSYTNWYLTRRT